MCIGIVYFDGMKTSKLFFLAFENGFVGLNGRVFLG